MILVVEDHDDTRRALVRLLIACGYEAVGVASGPEAVLFLNDHHPLLIILDWMMPGMTGVELLRTLRRQPRFDSVAVIFHTALGRERHEPQALSEGAQAFVVKGSPFSEFFAAIEQYAGKGKLHQQR